MVDIRAYRAAMAGLPGITTREAQRAAAAFRHAAARQEAVARQIARRTLSREEARTGTKRGALLPRRPVLTLALWGATHG